ncbi:MAG: hypothetical protein QW620_08185 [Thermoplasmata archaeon]
MKKDARIFVTLSLITVFFIAVLVRYPFVDYPPGNTDTYAYVFMSAPIIDTSRVPWLLHPFLSFFGLYPASDTSGPMILVATTYAVTNVPNLFAACTILDSFIILVFLISGYLLSSYLSRNKLLWVLPPLFIIVCPTFVLETNFFTVGSRLLAVMFFMCYFLCFFYFLFKHSSKRKKLKIFLLAIVFFIGGIASHLMGLFFAFFLFFPFLLTPLFYKLSDLLIRNLHPTFPKIVIKYGWVFFTSVIFVILALVYLGLAPVKFREFYASEQSSVISGRILGPLAQNPFVVVFLVYFSKIGFFVPLSALGIYALLKRGYNKRLKIFFMVAVSTILLFIYEAGYFPYVTTIVLTLLSLIGIDFILRNKKKISMFVIAISVLLISMTFYFYYSIFNDDYRSYYAAMCGIFIVITFLHIFLYRLWKTTKEMRKSIIKEKATVLALSCLLVFSVAYGIYSPNFDLAGDAEGKSMRMTPHYAPLSIVEIAYYSKFICESKRVLFPTYGGNTQFSAITGKTLYAETLTESPLFVESLSIQPVDSYDYHNPKTLYIGKSSDFPNIQAGLSGQVVIMTLYFTPSVSTLDVRKKYDINYTVEFLPYEGQYVSYGFKWTSAKSIFLKELNGSSYVTFMNSQFRMYYS